MVIRGKKQISLSIEVVMFKSLHHPFNGMLIRENEARISLDQKFQTGKHWLYKSFTANVKCIQ